MCCVMCVVSLFVLKKAYFAFCELLTSCSHSFLHPSLSLTKIGLASLSVGLLQETKKVAKMSFFHWKETRFSVPFHNVHLFLCQERWFSILHHSYECIKIRERKILESEKKRIKETTWVTHPFSSEELIIWFLGYCRYAKTTSWKEIMDKGNTLSFHYRPQHFQSNRK